MKQFLSFGFTRQQRVGIIALFLLIVVLQAGYFVYTSMAAGTSGSQSEEEKQWLSLQAEIDRLKSQNTEKVKVIYPFNPNFISDYKGYTLGMTVAEIDRLHKFRETGKFVNSAEDFKKVTGVHDTLLAKLSPYFKFPDWVIKKQQQSVKEHTYPNREYTSYDKSPRKEEKKIILKDINEALEEDLDEVYGIGPAFAKKILRRRAQLGAFVSMEQMDEIKDLSPEAVAGLKQKFRVSGQPAVTKININTASLNQLSYFTYFNKNIAKAIITRRSMKGKINNIEELLEINEFPVDKQKIIPLYLEF